jgi:hypothetical protein
MGLALLTIFYHSIILVVLRLRRRQPTNGSYIVEKGFVQAPAFNADKELFCTVPVMTSLGIIFAIWVVAIGSFLFEVALRPSATQIDKANVAIMILGALLVGAQTVRAYVRNNTMKATEASEVRLLFS